MSGKIKFFGFDIGPGLEMEFSGGAVRYYELLKALIQDGSFEITLALTSGGKKSLMKYFEKEPELFKFVVLIDIKASLFLKKEPFRLFRAWSYFVSMVHLRFLVVKLKRGKKFDVVYTPSDFFYEVFPAVWMKKAGIAKKISFIIFHHYPSPKERSGNFLVNWSMYQLQQWSFRIAVKYASFVFLLKTEEGKKVRDILLNYGLEVKSSFVTIGIDDFFLNSFGKTDKKYDAVHIGMRPNKGVFDLPEIWYSVVSYKKDAKLALIGSVSGDVRNKLEEEFVRLGIQENVDFLGFVDDQRKFELFSESKLFIAPSHEEGWGIAVGEAMLYGLPVVAYQLVVYESIYGLAIKYVDCFDKNAFGKSIANLLENPSVMETMRNIGKEKAAEYTWKKALQTDLEILKKGGG